MAYGIDDTIQQKVDAYRGNPGALQQRYAQNKELIDLLALQKLKTEKDAAARDMQMQMQQKPQTIAQQYEAELAGRTKQEMLKGVAGVMQNRQAKQQKNLQRVAQAGLPGAAARPAPKQMMAQGGIVGFASGGTPQEKLDEISRIRARTDIGEAEKERLIEEIAPTQVDPNKRSGISGGFLGSGKRTKIRSTTGGPTKATAEDPLDQVILDATTQGMTGTTEGSILGGGGTSSQRAPEQPQNIDSTLRQNMIPPAAPPAGDDTPPPGPKGPEVKPPTLLDSGLGQVASPTARTQFLDSAGYAVKMSDAASTEKTRAGIEGLMDTDAKGMRDDAFDYAMDKLGMSDDRIAKETARQQALANLDARQLDPKKLKQEQLSAFLRNTAKSGSFAGGSAGLANLRAQQELAERNRLLGRQAGEREFEGLQQDIKVKAFNSAEKAFEVANTNIRQGVSSMQAFNATEIGMLNDNAKSRLSADTANMEAEDRDARRILDAAISNASQGVKVAVANLEAETADRKMQLMAELDKLKIEQLDRTGAERNLAAVAKFMGEVRAKYEKIYQDRIGMLPPGTDQATVQKLRDEMNAAIVISLKDLRDRAKQIESRITGTYGDSTGQFQQGSMTVSP